MDICGRLLWRIGVERSSSALELGQSALAAASISKPHVSDFMSSVRNTLAGIVDWTILEHITVVRTHGL
jgi:hypothetical protein